MKVEARRCDRCSLLIDGPEGSSLQAGGPAANIDLCVRCDEAFREFLAEGADPSTLTELARKATWHLVKGGDLDSIYEMPPRCQIMYGDLCWDVIDTMSELGLKVDRKGEGVGEIYTRDDIHQLAEVTRAQKRDNRFECMDKQCDNVLIVSGSPGDEEGRGTARECEWSVASDDYGSEAVCPLHKTAWGR